MILRRWLRQTHAQDLIEYALLSAFISLAAYGAVAQLGGSLNTWYAAFSGDIAEKEKKSNCSASGMAHSQGKCHGGG